MLFEIKQGLVRHVQTLLNQEADAERVDLLAFHRWRVDEVNIDMYACVCARLSVCMCLDVCVRTQMYTYMHAHMRHASNAHTRTHTTLRQS